MRSISILILFASFATWGEARADRVHLPCDRDIGLSAGTGVFTGKTRNDAFGDIEFERVQPAFLRLEGTLFENCAIAEPERDAADADALNRKSKGKNPDLHVTRRWFGRLNGYGSVTPETSSLGFAGDPKPKLDEMGNPVYQTDADGNPILDENGEMIPATENGLIRASLETDMDFSGGFGARLSIYDHPHFHLEAYGEYAGTFGWNDAKAVTVIAHALEIDLDVTRFVQDHARLRYRWRMANTGLTVAVPLRPSTVDRNRVTPFFSFGRMWFRADVDVKLDEESTRDLESLGVDTSKITQRRTIMKESWLGFLGARVDFNRLFSLEASAAFAKTDNTMVYWLSGSATFRFDYPW